MKSCYYIIEAEKYTNVSSKIYDYEKNIGKLII